MGENELNRKIWRQFVFLFLIILPLFFTLIVPLGRIFIDSFFQYDSLFNKHYVGFENYLHIFLDKQTFDFICNSILLLVYVPLNAGIAFLLSGFLVDKKGFRWIKVIIYSPKIISIVVIGIVAQITFGLDGAANRFLLKLGLNSVYWFGNKYTALFIMVLCLVWINFGWQTIIFSSQLKSIPSNLIDLSVIDGLSFPRKLMTLYLPHLRKTILYSSVLSIVFSFCSYYPLIKVLTNGGPGYSTTTIDLYLYQNIRSGYRMAGQKCALIIVMLLLELLLILFVFILDILIQKLGIFFKMKYRGE